MQFFWRPGEPIQVCEIAARFFGYEHELVEISGGLSIEKLLLDSVYNLPSLEKTLETQGAILPAGGKWSIMYPVSLCKKTNIFCTNTV